MPGTRQATLAAVMKWTLSDNKPIMWLSGIAGTGKSSVMSSLFEIFDNHTTRLAAFIRFDRAEFSDASLFVRALAYQLAVFDGRLGRAISEALIRRPQITGHPQLSEQFDVLVREPLQRCLDLNREGFIVILVDGLDECTGEMRKQLLDLLSKSSALFEGIPFLRVIVSSRPEEDIYNAFQDCAHIHAFPLDTASTETIADIEYFITTNFTEADLPIDFRTWCEETNAISKLSRRASGLFIWASVAVAYILRSPHKIKQLQRVLDTNIATSALKTLDNLYKTALNSVADDISDEDIQNDACRILGAIMVVSRQNSPCPPLTMPILTSLLAHLNVTHVEGFINKLRSIMITSDNNISGLQLMHKSLDDFLTDESRCGKAWYIFLQNEYTNIAIACLSEIYAWLVNLDSSAPPKSFYRDTLIAFAFWTAIGILRKRKIECISSETVLYKKIHLWYSRYLLRLWYIDGVYFYSAISDLQRSFRSQVSKPSLVSVSVATKFPMHIF
jgi:hypothetical protein